MTHTFVTLEISAEAYDEIAAKLKATGDHHYMDMVQKDSHEHGIQLFQVALTKPIEVKQCPDDTCEWTDLSIGGTHPHIQSGLMCFKCGYLKADTRDEKN